MGTVVFACKVTCRHYNWVLLYQGTELYTPRENLIVQTDALKVSSFLSLRNEYYIQV